MDFKHHRKHNIGNAKDHKGDIYDALIASAYGLDASYPVASEPWVTDQILNTLKGLDWQESVLDMLNFGTNEPPTPTIGDRYIATTSTPSSNVTHQAITGWSICEWNGTSWTLTTPNEGYTLIVEDENMAYTYTPPGWVKFGTIVDHANLVNLAWSAAGHSIDTHVNLNGYTIYHDNGDQAISVGCHYTGGNWVADAATAAILYLSITGTLQWFYNSGLTPPNTFTPTERLLISAAGAVDGKDVSTLIANVVEDTTPQLGGNLDLNQKSVDYPALSTDHTWQGFTKTLTAGAATAWGSVCMMQSDGKVDPADASAVATGNGWIVFATTVLADTGTGTFLLANTEIRDDSWAWTAGLPLFLSETTGEMTQTAPTTSGAIVRILGHAITATTIMWAPEATWVVVP